HLKTRPTLTWVDVRRTKVTGDAALKFSQASPRCSVIGPNGQLPAWAADKAAVETFRPFSATLTLRLASGPTVGVRSEQPVPSGPYQVTKIDFIKAADKVPKDFAAKVLIPTAASLPALEGLDHVPPSAALSAEDLHRLADGPAATVFS